MKQFERQLTTLILIGLIVWLICLLSGCRSKQIAVQENAEISAIDTTKIETDSTATERAERNDTEAITAGSDSLIFEFVDSGGSVKIDKDGNLTATGVKKIRAGATYHKNETKATTATEKAVRVNNVTNKGLTNKGKRQIERTEKPVKHRWYENVLIKVGAICCIAAILWAIFLYIRRKF